MNRKSFILKLIVSLILIFLLLYKIKLQRIYETLLSINLIYISIVILITFITILLGSVNIWILFKGLDKKIKFRQIFHSYNASWGLTLFAPSKTGELSLIYLLKKEGIDAGTSTAVYFFDKIITLIITILIALIALLFLSPLDSLYVLISSIILIIIMFMIFISKKLIIKILPKKLKNTIEQFYLTFDKIKNRKDLIIKNSFTTFCRASLTFISFYMLFLAFGIKINMIYIIVFNTLLTLASLVPFTLSGLGLREVSAVYLFATIGIDHVITANVYLINIVKKYLFALFLIIFSRLKI
ncbi:MAG: lysylphosphatidylglycerol synthase transmembrane domain-containing protein [Nanoarchaeota archaeon]